MTFLELDRRPEAVRRRRRRPGLRPGRERGEFVSFLGPSGCGKTTTLRMIAGFEQPTAGTIAIDGEDVTTRPPNQRNVGMVFQSYALFPNMTVASNIAFGLKMRKRPKADIERRVGELLELIHLEDRGDRYPYQLSGGQQQRVALARALAFEPTGPPARRAALRARRQDPRRPAPRDPPDPAPARDHDRLRDPRPGGGARAVRPDRGHERGPDRADRHAVRDLQLPGHARSSPRSSARSTRSTRRSSTPRPAACRWPATRSARRPS